jgi:hypothetical protein
VNALFELAWALAQLPPALGWALITAGVGALALIAGIRIGGGW